MDRLPSDILGLIFEQLEPVPILERLRATCRRFRDRVNTERYWRSVNIGPILPGQKRSFNRFIRRLAPHLAKLALEEPILTPVLPNVTSLRIERVYSGLSQISDKPRRSKRKSRPANLFSKPTFPNLRALTIADVEPDSDVQFKHYRKLERLELRLHYTAILIDQNVDFWTELRVLKIHLAGKIGWNLIGVFHLLSEHCRRLQEVELSSDSQVGAYPVYLLREMAELEFLRIASATTSFDLEETIAMYILRGLGLPKLRRLTTSGLPGFCEPSVRTFFCSRSELELQLER